MARKYKFRKVYFVCYDNQVIRSSISMDTFYKNKFDADEEQEKLVRSYQPYVMNNPHFKPPKVSVEGFYLVHEKLFDEVLAPYQKVILKPVKDE